MASTTTSTLRKKPSVVNLNKNTNWLEFPGVWAWYLGLIVAFWLVASSLVDAGVSWTYTHLVHSVVTYYLFHWMKGSPIEDDQGEYDDLTFWEQIDNCTQRTRTRKFLTVVPVVLFMLATHATDYRQQPLFLNLLAVVILLVAKLPALHTVRILGINKY